MPSNQVSDLFRTYAEFQTVVRSEGVKEVLDDLNHFYTDLYTALEEEFKRRQKVKELGVLLAGSP